MKTAWERWKIRLERRSDGSWFNPEGVDDESFFQSLEEVRGQSLANSAFYDLADPEEDVYTLDDGEPFLDQS